MFLCKRKNEILKHVHYDEWITSFRGLKLHCIWFPQVNCKRITICFCGYANHRMKDYAGFLEYYLDNGYSVLLVDGRVHGKGVGKNIAFGVLDRLDALDCVKWIIKKLGDDVEIFLHGTGLGATTVLTTSGLELPP